MIDVDGTWVPGLSRESICHDFSMTFTEPNKELPRTLLMMSPNYNSKKSKQYETKRMINFHITRDAF